MKTAILIIFAALLTGCASIEHAGYDSYVLKSFTAPLGMTGCCELTVTSGKEYDGRSVRFETNGAGAVLTIQEVGAKAFKGQALAVKALTVLPVSGLQDLIK